MRSAIVVGLLALGVSAHAHPQHRTTAQADVRADRGVLEVALRVHPADLARAIELRDESTLTAPDSEQKLRAYLQRRFRVVQEDAVSTLRWVGLEPEGSDLWLYFELPIRKGPAELSNRVFFELFETQINVLRLRNGTQSRTVSLTAKSKALKTEF
ncbi:MAG: DUF6702 family protein [Myxococcota bacterium]